MFWLFKSKRNWWRDEARKLFDVYVDSLKGMDGSEIGPVLDIARRFKDSMLQKIPPQDPYTPLVFLDPLAMSEEASLSYLEKWHKRIRSANPQTEAAVVGVLTIWWLSLAAAAFAELRFRGREMWSQLARGFPYCATFDPEVDVPKGLEAQK